MALMMIAAQASAEEALPLGFLEFLGGMVEVRGADDTELLDPLDFEKLLESEMDASERTADPDPSDVDQMSEVAR